MAQTPDQQQRNAQWKVAGTLVFLLSLSTYFFLRGLNYPEPNPPAPANSPQNPPAPSPGLAPPPVPSPPSNPPASPAPIPSPSTSTARIQGRLQALELTFRHLEAARAEKLGHVEADGNATDYRIIAQPDSEQLKAYSQATNAALQGLTDEEKQGCAAQSQQLLKRYTIFSQPFKVIARRRNLGSNSSGNGNGSGAWLEEYSIPQRDSIQINGSKLVLTGHVTSEILPSQSAARYAYLFPE